MNQHSDIYRNVKTSERRYLHGRTGISGVVWGQTIGETSVTTELYIHGALKKKNKSIFAQLIKRQEEIEKQFDEAIEWARLDDKVASRIKRRKLENVNCTNKEDWNRMIDFMVYGILRMEKAFREPLARIKLELAK